MKNKRKGFTIVELVIVIAVIAILAAVLIPTFAGIIGKANDSAALQEARNAYTAFIADHDYTTGDPARNLIVKVSENEYVAVKDAQMDGKVYANEADALKAIADNAAKADADTAFTAEGGIEVYAVCAAHADADSDSKCDSCGGEIAAAN